jgi:hypothetical protein
MDFCNLFSYSLFQISFLPFLEPFPLLIQGFPHHIPPCRWWKRGGLVIIGTDFCSAPPIGEKQAGPFPIFLPVFCYYCPQTVQPVKK